MACEIKSSRIVQNKGIFLGHATWIPIFPALALLAIMDDITGHRHRSHISRSSRGHNFPRFEPDLILAWCGVLPPRHASHVKFRQRHNPTPSEPLDATKLLSDTIIRRDAWHFVFLPVMEAANSPTLYRLYGVITSRAPIPFLANFRSNSVGSHRNNLPLATGSGTKAMAEAMRAKKVAICLYMVAIEG